MEQARMRREVEKAISRLKNKTAPGEDGIKAGVLKSLRSELESTVAKLLIKIKREGAFPDIWKRGVVKLVKKREDKPNEEFKSYEYRPVTLLPVMGKLAERVIAGWLKEGIEGEISARQYGFRRGMGARNALNKFRKCVQGMGKM